MAAIGDRGERVIENYVFTNTTESFTEMLKKLSECDIAHEDSNTDEVAVELDRLTSWMMHAGLEPMKGVAATLRLNREEILNYFDHRFTNAILEGLNSIIQAAKRTARGFCNPRYFKAAIYLNLGKLRFPVMESCATH